MNELILGSIRRIDWVRVVDLVCDDEVDSIVPIDATGREWTRSTGTSSTVWDEDLNRNVYQFNNNGYIETPHDLLLNLGLDNRPFRVGYKIKSTVTGRETCLIAKRTTQNNATYWFGSSTTGRLYYFCSGSGYAPQYRFTTPIHNGVWNTILAEFDGTKLRFYINGVYESMIDDMIIGAQNTGVLSIGRNPVFPSGYYTDGRIADLFIDVEA